MRILIVKSDLPFPLVSGSNLLTYGLIKALSKRHEVELVSLLHSKSQLAYRDHLEQIGVKVHTVFAGYERTVVHRHWNKLCRLGKRVLCGVPRGVSYAAPIEFRNLVRKTLEDQEYDLVQIDFWHTAGLVAWIRDIPTVLYTHQVYSDTLTQVSATCRNPVQRFVLTQYAKAVQRYETAWFPRFDHIVCVTDRDQGLLSERFPQYRHKIKTLPLLWLESQDESGSPKACPEKNSMVIVGDMDHHPNVDAVLYFVHEVLPLIKKELPDCILYVVGKNPRAEVRNLGKGNRDVKVVGFVPDVLPYISGAGVFICPIRKTDGIKIKLIEAMHSGKAIVASSAALFGYDVKDGEEILVADSAKEFARKVLLVLRNDDMALRIGRNANNYVRKHHMGAEIEGQILLEYERWSNATPSSQPYPEPLH